MEVEVKDLRKGDEIIIAKNSQLACLKLLVDPQVRKQQPKNGRIGVTYYKSVKCSYRLDVVPMQWQYGARLYNSNKLKYGTEGHNHNKEARIELNNRTIWLIKKH